MIREHVDEVVVIANLKHILDPHPHSEYTSAASEEGHGHVSHTDSADMYNPQEHYAVLNLTAIAQNFISLGHVDTSKLRILIEPYHLLPGKGNFNPEDFNDANTFVRRHPAVRKAAVNFNHAIPDLLPQQLEFENVRRNRMLNGGSKEKTEHPDGYLSFLNTRKYFVTALPRQHFTSMLVFEWREAGNPARSISRNDNN